MAAWMEISSSSQTNRLSLRALKLPADRFFLFLRLFFFFFNSSYIWKFLFWCCSAFYLHLNRGANSFLDLWMCVCVCEDVSEIINEPDKWPLFEIWNCSQLYNITAIEQQSDVNWIWVMTFLCSGSAECLSDFPSLSFSLADSHFQILSVSNRPIIFSINHLMPVYAVFICIYGVIPKL